MKSLFLPALLLFAVACGKSADHETAKVSGGRSAEVGVVETVYEVLEELDRTRVGFVNKTSYDSGRVVYWVVGPNYRDRMGYVLANNRAYKYEYVPGGKRVETALVADTRNANVRRVLDHNKVVVLVPISQDALRKQLLKGRYDKPKAPAKAEGCGGGCGCGDE